MAQNNWQFTPLSKIVFAVVIVAVVGFVYYKNYGNPMSRRSAPTEHVDDKTAFGNVQQSGNKPQTAQTPVQTAPVGNGKLNRPLKVAINTWAGHSPGLVANGGLDTTPGSINEKLGVNVTYSIIEEPPAKLAAFQSGSIDIMWDTVDSWAREAGEFQRQGLGARAIVQEDFSFGGDAIVSTGDIRNVEDLKGKKIALVQFSPSHWLLLYTLSQSNLSKSDIANIESNLTFIGSSADAAKTFLAKQVDAVVTWEPDVTNSVKGRAGAHVLFDTKAASKVIGDVLVARQDVLDRYPQSISAFVNGWFRGVEASKENIARARKVVGKALNLPPDGDDGVEGMLSGLTMSNWADNAWFFGLSLPQGEESHYENLFGSATTVWRSRNVISTTSRASDRAAPKFIAALAPEFQQEQQTEAPKMVATARITPETTGVLNKQVTVNFETGSARILDDSTDRLDDLASALRSFGNTAVKIEGHTDAQGSAAINKRLSEQRAQAVRNYLVEKAHVSADRFKTYGFGPSRPVASNASADGRARNRRTEIRLIPNE